MKLRVVIPIAFAVSGVAMLVSVAHLPEPSTPTQLATPDKDDVPG